MSGARWAAALACAAGLWIGWGAAIAAPEDQGEAKETCLASPKGAPPAGERWFYRVERGTKRHCWYTRAAGEKRAVGRPPQVAAAPKSAAAPVVAEPAPPEETLQLDRSVADARAEANISATAAITAPARSDAARAASQSAELGRAEPRRAEPAPVDPARDRPSTAWQMAERWSEHQNGGAPFDASYVASRTVAPTPAPEPNGAGETEMSTSSLVVIAGAALGSAGLGMTLFMVFARRQQRKEATSEFALFATTDDPKRRLMARRAGLPPTTRVGPRLDRSDDAPPLQEDFDHDGLTTQPPTAPDQEVPMRPFTPRNMRMDRA